MPSTPMKRPIAFDIRMVRVLLAFAVTLLGLIQTGTASAETRIALVIGNGRYAAAPLTNPVNDAALIRDTLKGAGFTVRHVENADRGAMVRSIQALGRDLVSGGRDSVGLFYFSGHGVQSDGRNYLLPIGGRIDTEADLLPEAVDADWVLKQMEQAGNPLNIVILDACRNNTLAVASKSATKGLARMVAPVGSVVAFATDSGTVAYDGRGRNSPYAAALAKFMTEPGLELKAVFSAVGYSVFSETQSQSPPQTPVENYKLTPLFYFHPSAPLQINGLSSTARQLPVSPPASLFGIPKNTSPPENFHLRIRGVWSGEGTQNNGGRWSMRLSVSDDGRYRIDYPSLQCGGEWHVVELGPDSIKLRERITYGSGCIKEGDVLLTNEDLGNIRFIYRAGRYSANAILRRKSEKNRLFE